MLAALPLLPNLDRAMLPWEALPSSSRRHHYTTPLRLLPAMRPTPLLSIISKRMSFAVRHANGVPYEQMGRCEFEIESI